MGGGRRLGVLALGVDSIGMHLGRRIRCGLAPRRLSLTAWAAISLMRSTTRAENAVSYLNADLYDALRSAGADEAMARKASESVRAPDQLSERIDGLDKRLGILMWMVGLNIGCTIGLYALLFRALP